jgi:hypothetical protein
MPVGLGLARRRTRGLPFSPSLYDTANRLHYRSHEIAKVSKAWSVSGSSAPALFDRADATSADNASKCGIRLVGNLLPLAGNRLRHVKCPLLDSPTRLQHPASRQRRDKGSAGSIPKRVGPRAGNTEPLVLTTVVRLAAEQLHTNARIDSATRRTGRDRREPFDPRRAS